MRKYSRPFEVNIAEIGSEGKMKNSFTYMNSYPLQEPRLPLAQGSRITDRTQLQMIEATKKIIDKDIAQELGQKFKSIKSTPLVSKVPASFNREDYFLEQSEKLEVCRPKNFYLSNYYNYLYEQEVERINHQIKERNRKIEETYNTNQMKNQPANQPPKQYDPVVIKKIGFEEKILDPVHIKHQQRQAISFNPKQRERMGRSQPQGKLLTSNLRSGWGQF